MAVATSIVCQVAPLQGTSPRGKAKNTIVEVLELLRPEVLIPADHGGFSHPKAIAEIARILKGAQ